MNWIPKQGEQLLPPLLNLDLDQESLPKVVSEILAGTICTRAGDSISESVIWSWSIAERLQALLAVAKECAGGRRSISLRCQHVGCGGVMLATLELDAFVCTAVPRTVSCETNGSNEILVRMPTGRDQESWLTAQSIEQATLARDLIDSIDGARPDPDWQLPSDWIPSISKALDDGDPLTSLELVASCHECGTLNQVPFDLEAELVRVIKEFQYIRLNDIHNLAGAYGWTESQIISLPRWRREIYLAKVNGTMGQGTAS